MKRAEDEPDCIADTMFIPQSPNGMNAQDDEDQANGESSEKKQNGAGKTGDSDGLFKVLATNPSLERILKEKVLQNEIANTQRAASPGDGNGDGSSVGSQQGTFPLSAVVSDGISIENGDKSEGEVDDEDLDDEEEEKMQPAQVISNEKPQMELSKLESDTEIHAIDATSTEILAEQ
jgi:hypothetical protein